MLHFWVRLAGCYSARGFQGPLSPAYDDLNTTSFIFIPSGFPPSFLLLLIMGLFCVLDSYSFVSIHDLLTICSFFSQYYLDSTPFNILYKDELLQEDSYWMFGFPASGGCRGYG
jgi:hypothetical protein